MRNFSPIIFLLLAINLPVSSQEQELEEPADSVIAAASERYRNPDILKRVFMGTNYRKVWGAEVKIPVFNIKSTNGGYVITGRGGGLQTRSLRLKDSLGKEWVLRSVDKNVDPAMDNKFKKVVVKGMAQDQISGAHPYAPLVVGKLAASAGIPAPQPFVYFVPDDPALGEHRGDFANEVCFLEEREPTLDGSEATSTIKVLEKLSQRNDHLILQRVVLKARLLDMLVGDWDRHADQWKWGVIKSGQEERYYAIPRDRDFALFHSNGVMVKLMRKFGMPQLIGFNEDGKDLKQLNAKSYWFDLTFLNELNAAEWEKGIKEFQQLMSDSVIHLAACNMPTEAYAISGKEIEERLRKRRDNLLKSGMEYYRHISQSVVIPGSDQSEFFRVINSNGKFTVTVYGYESGDTTRKLYHREFNEDETYLITLTGLGGNDHFEVQIEDETRIRMKLAGGEGQDVYNVNKKMKIEIEDQQQGGEVSKKKT